MHLPGAEGALQLLAIELRLLDLLDADAALDGQLGAAVVAPAGAAGDQIRDPAALLSEGARVHGVAEELLAELDHLEESDAHDCCFRIVAPALAVDEAGREGDDILQRAGDGDAGDVGSEPHVEVGAVEEGF